MPMPMQLHKQRQNMARQHSLWTIFKLIWQESSKEPNWHIHAADSRLFSASLQGLPVFRLSRKRDPAPRHTGHNMPGCVPPRPQRCLRHPKGVHLPRGRSASALSRIRGSGPSVTTAPPRPLSGRTSPCVLDLNRVAALLRPEASPPCAWFAFFASSFQRSVSLAIACGADWALASSSKQSFYITER